MKKMSASDMTYYIAKAGDIIKGSGKGNMSTGMKVIIAISVVVGGALAVVGQTVFKKLSSDKSK